MLYLVFVQFGKFQTWIGLIVSYGAATTTTRTTITPRFFTGPIRNAVTIATEDIAEATAASRIHARYQTNAN